MNLLSNAPQMIYGNVPTTEDIKVERMIKSGNKIELETTTKKAHIEMS